MCRFLFAITSPHDLHACTPADKELILDLRKWPCAMCVIFGLGTEAKGGRLDQGFKL